MLAISDINFRSSRKRVGLRTAAGNSDPEGQNIPTISVMLRTLEHFRYGSVIDVSLALLSRTVKIIPELDLPVLGSSCRLTTSGGERRVGHRSGKPVIDGPDTGHAGKLEDSIERML